MSENTKERRIKPLTRRLLLILHLCCSSVWVGAVIALLLLAIMASQTTHQESLVTLHNALKWIEYGLIIPPAFGAMITGFFLSGWTNWGFFKYWWVTVKWIVTVGLILFGAFFLNTWIEGMAAISQLQGLAAFQDPTYSSYAWLNLVFVAIQWGLLLFLVVISVLKPWGKRKAKA